jgi:proteic killer suppression protein
MIKTFADKRTQKIYEGHKVKRAPLELQKKALRRLRYIDAAERIEDLMVPPSNKLEKKIGDMEGFYGIWVTRQFRIIFRFEDGNAYDAQFIDDH